MHGPAEAVAMYDDPRVAEQTRAVLQEGAALFVLGEEAGVPLRFIGSLAVQMVCPSSRHLAGLLDRRPSLDIDFVGYAADERRIEAVFNDAGHTLHPAVKHSREYGIKRLIFVPPATEPKVDIFLDDLVMAHTVAFKGRLGLSSPTVSLVDLLLSKLQIHEMTRNDQIDLVILLADHDLSRNGGKIDGDYLSSVLGRDWGFHYSARANLQGLLAALEDFEQLTPEIKDRVAFRTNALLRVLDDAPKSSRWKMRARMGTRVRWYEDVQEVT